MSTPTTSRSSDEYDIISEKTGDGLSKVAGIEAGEVSTAPLCTETEQSHTGLGLDRADQPRDGQSLAEEQREAACASTSPREKNRGGEAAEKPRNGLSLAKEDGRHQPEGRSSFKENRQAEIHPTDSQPNRSEEITCRAHNSQKKLFPIFKQSAVTGETKSLVENEQIQPSGRYTEDKQLERIV